jgi:hypothetical protein
MLKKYEIVVSKLQKFIPKYYFNSDTSNEDILDAAQKYKSDLPSNIEALGN